ncbi:hypothetical protein WJX72_001369 [[Myrmecia] bisecta]|uniref:TauD/TfdA-like domain-containing protein n=1 Tax=[Myrmecia] bisecta TaxID=41462 RepID=A0AAW1Q855_9CHLO
MGLPRSKQQLHALAAELGFELTPLHRNFGAQVSGVDLTKDLDDSTKGFLLAAMAEYDMLLFRGRALHPRDQERLLTVFPHDEAALKEQRFCNQFFSDRVPGCPLITVRFHDGGKGEKLVDHYGVNIEAKEPPADYSKFKPFYGSMLWHQDMSDSPTPPEISSIYMVEVPDKGGETVFASAVTAYSNLSAEEKERVRKLRTVNTRAAAFINLDMSEDGLERLDDMEEAISKAKEAGTFKEQPRNPFVIKDPATGKESILIYIQGLRNFEGMGRKESVALVRRILEPATAESEVYVVDWQPHDFAVWANRRMLHSGTPGKHYLGLSRRLYHLAFLDSKAPLVPADESLASEDATSPES